MSIFDGWKLWAGKALFDLTILVGIIMTAILAFFGVYAFLWVREKYRAIRSSLGKSDG